MELQGTGSHNAGEPQAGVTPRLGASRLGTLQGRGSPKAREPHGWGSRKVGGAVRPGAPRLWRPKIEGAPRLGSPRPEELRGWEEREGLGCPKIGEPQGREPKAGSSQFGGAPLLGGPRLGPNARVAPMLPAKTGVCKAGSSKAGEPQDWWSHNAGRSPRLGCPNIGRSTGEFVWGRGEGGRLGALRLGSTKSGSPRRGVCRGVGGRGVARPGSQRLGYPKLGPPTARRAKRPGEPPGWGAKSESPKFVEFQDRGAPRAASPEAGGAPSLVEPQGWRSPKVGAGSLAVGRFSVDPVSFPWIRVEVRGARRRRIEIVPGFIPRS